MEQRRDASSQRIEIERIDIVTMLLTSRAKLSIESRA